MDGSSRSIQIDKFYFELAKYEHPMKAVLLVDLCLWKNTIDEVCSKNGRSIEQAADFNRNAILLTSWSDQEERSPTLDDEEGSR
eukprot:scaffold4531_cov103-Cylindrotheca_fusiformis.AAC.11